VKKYGSILVVPFLILLPFLAFAERSAVDFQKADTIVIQPTKEDQVIDEVVTTTTPVKKQDVQYLSQVTKYGFKNLFKNYSYNPSMPYSAQVNPYAETYMQDYLHGHTKYLQNLRQTGVPYFNFIDGILVQYGLPKELKYLAVIESNLKATALSSAGARGPWQFMSYTAKDYGLQVNQYADDRTDYSKSTHAAAKYLLNLYKDLKDWLLVIAAYNGGPGRVYSAIKKSGSRNFWNLQYYLPEESRNHVKKFIATHYIMETAGDDASSASFNYKSLSRSQFTAPVLSDSEKASMDTMSVSGRYKAGVISQFIKMDQKEFDHYNPGFDQALSGGADYKMQLPQDKMELFVAGKLPILDACVRLLFNNAGSSFLPPAAKPVVAVKK
jgi:membrane-bound lytic murein transglycosylase D